MIKKVKVTVDKNLCVGCGTCFILAPEVFDYDDTTRKSVVKKELFEYDIDKLREIAASCPVLAIKVEEQ